MGYVKNKGWETRFPHNPEGFGYQSQLVETGPLSATFDEVDIGGGCSYHECQLFLRDFLVKSVLPDLFTDSCIVYMHR